MELAPEVYFPIKNAPVELYAKHVLRLPDPLTPTYENATIGGERAVKVYINFTELVDKAIKVYINSTELALATGTPNVTSSINSTELALATGLPSALIGRNSIFYFVMHDDQPYYLNYIANAKDFEKYLPEFEQMLKTFKFTK